MMKHQILSSYITCAPMGDVVSEIITLAKNRKPAYVCFANVHMVVDAHTKKAFQDIVNAAHIASPDGKPVAVAMNLLYGARQERVAGPEAMNEILKRANDKKLSVYFYGSTDDVLTEIRNKLAQEYPHVVIAGMKSPPFRPASPQEEKDDVEVIRQSGAQIVFVGLGCPKQEQWMYRNYQQLQAVLLGVGAAFPFFTGQLKRAPRWMQNSGLEWLYRIYAEPRRLFARYFVTNTLFLFFFAQQMLRQISENFRKPNKPVI